VLANLDLLETEVLVDQTLAVPAQPGCEGKDEPEWPHAREVVREEDRQFLGIAGALGGGPFRQESVNVLGHVVSFDGGVPKA
jgi:hypothetical protein